MSTEFQRPSVRGDKPDSPTSDARLLRRIAAKDETAMACLYDRHAALLNGIALRITGNPSDAAEVLQESFLQIWNQAERYRQERGSVLAWLCTIVRSRSIDYLRGRSRHSLAHVAKALQDERIHTPPSPEQATVAGNEYQRLRAALDILSPPERKALELSYFGGLSHSEIAHEMSLPLGTVKTHIARGIRKLRKTIRTGDSTGDSGHEG